MRARFDARLIKATVFRAASIERWMDAASLHKASRFHGAIYLCGYALECELKYQICKSRRTERMELGEAKQLGHELAELLDRARKAQLLSRNRDLFVAFQAISSNWSTEMRYSGVASSGRDSERFLKDSWALLSWLRIA